MQVNKIRILKWTFRGFFWGQKYFNNFEAEQLTEMKNPISQRIKELRRDLSLSQGEFAKMLKVSKGHVSNLETGHANPSDQLLSLICEVFNVEWDWIELGQGEMYMPSPAERERQVAFFHSLLGQLSMFYSTYQVSKPLLEEMLKEAAHLSGGLCPFDVTVYLWAVTKIADAEVIELARARLKDWADWEEMDIIEKEGEAILKKRLEEMLLPPGKKWPRK